MEGIRARYNDGKTARTREVVVRIERSGLDIGDDDGTRLDHWPAQAVRLVEEPSRPGPLRLAREDGAARLTIEDAGVLAGLEALCPDLRAARRIRRRGALRIAAWTLAAGLSVGALIEYVIPLFAARFAAAVPIDVEERIGANLSEQLVRLLSAADGDRPAACAAPDGVRALQRLVDRLAGKAGLGGPAITVRVVDSPVVNAFALPGGRVLLLRGMIDFADDAEQLAGVVAHEIGHVVHRHPSELMFKAATVSALVGLVVGDIAGGTVVAALAQRIVTGGYGREAEREADRFALALLERAGIDPGGLARLFAKLAAREAESAETLQFLSTHPPTRQRARDLARAGRPEAKALDGRQWRSLRGICG